MGFGRRLVLKRAHGMIAVGLMFQRRRVAPRPMRPQDGGNDAGQRGRNQPGTGDRSRFEHQFRSALFFNQLTTRVTTDRTAAAIASQPTMRIT